jgi:hypothetical protein
MTEEIAFSALNLNPNPVLKPSLKAYRRMSGLLPIRWDCEIRTRHDDM